MCAEDVSGTSVILSLQSVKEWHASKAVGSVVVRRLFAVIYRPVVKNQCRMKIPNTRKILYTLPVLRVVHGRLSFIHSCSQYAIYKHVNVGRDPPCHTSCIEL
jgi:hypothetical protein